MFGEYVEPNDSKQDEGDSISYLTLGDAMNRFTEPAVRSAIRALELPSGSNGLDAGCGIGNHTLWLAEAVSSGGYVTGVDISDECLAKAKERARKSEMMEQVSFRMGDIYNLPFEDDTFDWVWSADVLYLWLMESGSSERPLPVMKELSRVVKPGGKIAFFFWSSQKLLPGHPLLEARLNATEAANFAGPHGIPPELHSSRALGWFQRADLKDPKVQTFIVEAQAPLTDEVKDSLTGTFNMFWEKTKTEVAEEVWSEYQRLCNPGSSDFILNLPDYHCFITYSLFYGAVVKSPSNL